MADDSHSRGITPVDEGAQPTKSAANALKLDHVLMAVTQLSAAKAKCEHLGFNVVYGGRERRALNALIFLKDGTMIELIGKDRFPAAVSMLRAVGLSRLFGLAIDRIAAFSSVAPGLFNFSLYAPSLRATYLRLRASEIAVSKPLRLARQRDDGVRLSWELLGVAPYDLPFFIGDYKPGRLRDDRLTGHANGALGIASLTIGCRDVARYTDIYERLLDRPRSGGGETTFMLEDVALRLAAAQGPFRGFTTSDQSRPLSCVLRYQGDIEHPLAADEIANAS